MPLVDLSPCLAAVERSEPLRVYGKIVEITGLLIKATGLAVSIGEACEIYSDGGAPVEAEVVGFRDGKALLMAIGDLSRIKLGSRVHSVGKKVFVRVGQSLIGRVIDGMGNPIDGKGPLRGNEHPLFAVSPDPLKRQRITEPIDLGVRAMNGLLTCGKGQRLGIMAAAGVGKSVLLGMIAKYTEASVNVIALVGERGREVREFMERNLGEEGMRKSVVVVSTSEQPALMKLRAAFTATAIAEYFREAGNDVLLFMDSLTRVAMAQREIGLALGEPPTTKGYTPSLNGLLSKLLERAGTKDGKGSITGLYTVLVEGDDLSDPVADASMAILDGHIVLSRELAMENQYPAIDVLRSVSRVMPDIVDPAHKEAAGRFSEVLATYRKHEDMIAIGAYKEGSNPKVDRSIRMIEGLKGYLRQGMNEHWKFRESVAQLHQLLSGYGDEPARNN
ncbi:MAG: flagellar protein export ATPase FliI [Deltaproteobacteria bacterium]|nr:flagellar protein export ATPase FliI [Deltaproteobacteria bacterium]